LFYAYYLKRQHALYLILYRDHNSEHNCRHIYFIPPTFRLTLRYRNMLQH